MKTHDCLAITLIFLFHECIHYLTAEDGGLIYVLPSTCAASPDQKVACASRPRSYHAGIPDDCSSGHNDGMEMDVALLSTTKREIRPIVNTKSKFSKIFDRSHLPQSVFSKKGKRDWIEITRWSGGANFAVNTDESSQQNDPSSPNQSYDNTSETHQGRKSFLGDLLIKKRQSFLPKEAEEKIRSNFQQALAFVQKATERAGPSFLTALSLVGKSDQRNEISFLTVYTIALLGSSCGFHLFLHFITLGYALVRSWRVGDPYSVRV